MYRLLPLLLSLTLLTAACKKEKNDPAPESPQEAAGPLEGNWKTLSVETVLYDRQGKLVGTYKPLETMGYTSYTITTTDIHYYNSKACPINCMVWSTPYVRTGDQLTCQPPAMSYTIRKLTATKLDLYLIGEYGLDGIPDMRTDHTIHLERQ
ncbi:hypothetical protein DNI29_21225 [Hymenobacter sediminis]|uniref:hypothetical protein n=1 Tax=Hymenobacter sediminis TaxID=2218621 RepID=UPI000DA6CD8B|nr:hypothetical protein [Hymenobacter sediminis]RPD44653.1 hypothetical protein DNI29_21225 [Hymenobacter sediminis]